jgi:hypothetical protein
MLLIADADLTSTSNPNRVTVGSMFNDALNNGIYTTGSFTNKVTAGSFVGNLTGNVTGTIVGTSGTLAGFNSTTGTIVGLNSTTGTIVTGTVSTLNSTTGTITTLNSTTSTITNLAVTTSTFLGTITGSTNVVNIGSGQIYKDATGNVYLGATSKPVSSSNASVQVVGQGMALASNSAYTPQLGLFGANATAGAAPYVLVQRSRGSYSSPTTVSSGDNIGNFFYGGHDGTSYVNNAGIASFVDGAVSTGTVPSALSFQTGSVSPTERMRIDSSGNVGIGITTGTSKLNIYGATGAANATWAGGSDVLLLNNSASFSEQAIAFQETTSNVGAKIGVKNTANGAYDIIFANRANTSATSSITEKMRIDSLGNVGIGTTTPVNKLDVVGSFGRGAPVSKTSSFTLADSENWIIWNSSTTGTATLPAASTCTGREITLKAVQATSLVSAFTNISQITATPSVVTNVILPATDGAWVTLVSNGQYWIVMATG